MTLPRGETCANPFGSTLATRHGFAGKAVLMGSYRGFGMLVKINAPSGQRD
jgi:hypothetical protein